MNINYIVIGIAIIIIISIIVFYNVIIKRKNEIENAFGSIEAMLKKRYDLLPNLVELVKKYMSHEKEVLVEITNLRTQINGNYSTNEKLEKHNSLQKQIDRLMLNVENYPDLKASQNFLDLQSAWTSTEEQISAARRYYNSAVTDYNNSIEMFPSNLLAKIFGFKSQNTFEISENERENVNAKELF